MGKPSIEDIVRTVTECASAEIVPEIPLLLARDAHDVFSEVPALVGDGAMPPYWAFAWPGGQAMARFILDWPGLVTGKSVVDIGAGSGITSIAAAHMGAAHVLAADIDPLSAAAMHLNAALNEAAVDITSDDLLGTLPAADIIIIGDLVYEPQLETRVALFLERALDVGATILFADRTTARRPRLPFEQVAEYVAPVTPLLHESHIERARVWCLGEAAQSLVADTQSKRTVA